MASVIKCDICKNIIDDYKLGMCIQFKPLRSSVCDYTEYKSFDLCTKCISKLNKAMKMIKKDK